MTSEILKSVSEVRFLRLCNGVIQRWILLLLVVGFVSIPQPDLVRAEGGISFNFRNVEIRTIIESVAKITGENFFIDPRVRGRITLLSNSTIDNDKLTDVLKMLLSLNGFQAIETEYAIMVVPSQTASSITPKPGDKKRKELYDRVTEIIAINNVPTNTMTQILQPFLSRQSRIQVVPGSNKIIVSDIRVNLDRLRRIISQIDKVTASDFDVLELKHAAVSDVLRSVRAIFGSSSLLKLEADQRTNRLFIVSDSLDTRLAVRAIVAELDIALPREQGSGSLQVFYLRYAEAAKIAPIISATLSSSAYKNLVPDATTDTEKSAAEKEKKSNEEAATSTFVSKADNNNADKFSIQADGKLNAIIVAGDSKTIFIARELIKQLDLPRKQVSMEIIIAEISDSKLYELGFNYLDARNGFGTNLGNNSVSTLIGAFDADGATTRAKVGVAGVRAATGASGFFGFGVGLNEANEFSWASLVRAIDNDGESNVLSTPYITTLDNEKATLVSGSEVPVETGSQTTSNNSVFRTVARKKVGINLAITPQIGNNDEIIMDIKQSLSSVDSGSTTSSGLVTQEREINTKIHARSREIIVMGGLQESRISETTERVPLLGRIPFLGKLFSYERQEVRTQNLIVFLRPTVINSSEDVALLNSKKYDLFRSKINTEQKLSLDFLRRIDELLEVHIVPPALTYGASKQVSAK